MAHLMQNHETIEKLIQVTKSRITLCKSRNHLYHKIIYHVIRVTKSWNSLYKSRNNAVAYASHKTMESTYTDQKSKTRASTVYNTVKQICT